MMVDSSPKFSGDPTAEALSNGLATLGRYGDSYMVHAAEGETVIPKEILDANPGLKDDLFRQMTMMGIRNPNRYVVGSDLNSINPITGQPEFFFKKLFKAAKRIGKKILPVLAPIIGNLIAPGIGGLIASGLVTKMQGGSWGDAAKSAALAYGVGALGRGVQGFGRGQGFFSSLGSGLAEPWKAAGNLLSPGRANPLAQGIFGPRGTGTLFQGLARTDPTFGEQNKFFGKGTDWQKSVFPSYESTPAGTLAGKAPASTEPKFIMVQEQDPASGQWRDIMVENPKYVAPPGAGAGAGAGAGTGAKQGWLAGIVGEKGADAISQAIPAFGAAALVYYLTPDERSVADQLALLDEANPQRAAYTQSQNIADKDSPEARALKAQWYGQPSYTATQLASSFGANPLVGITPGTPGAPAGIDPTDLTWIPGTDGPIQPPTARVNELPHPLGTGPFGELGLMGAAGGEVMGRGTGTSDSIPARLSDGEFVMTAEAVRNAGGGNRALGAARMYDMMNRFERGAA